MIKTFLQEKTIITGSLHNFMKVSDLYNEYIKWLHLTSKSSEFVILPSEKEFEIELYKYPELYFVRKTHCICVGIKLKEH